MCAGERGPGVTRTDSARTVAGQRRAPARRSRADTILAEGFTMTFTRSKVAPGSAAGFSLIELLIVIALISVVASIAVPGLVAAKKSANEASAIGSARTASSAQSAYAGTCGNGAFAPSGMQ